MVKSIKTNWVLAACVLFVLINAFLVSREIYWFMALPAILLVIWAMISSLDRLLLFIVFAAPLSLNIEDLELGGIGFYLPTEPLMFAIMVLFVLKLVLEKNTIHPQVLKHPVTIAVCINLLWLAVCIVPSEMPLVSLKFLISRLWFVTTLYFLCTRIFEKEQNMHRFAWLYMSGLAIVVTYTLIHHSQYGFEHDPAHWVMTPFFKDHTSYGASIAFMLPFALLAIGMPGYSRTRKGVAIFFLLLLTAGLIFSFTRAAWVSLVGALGVYLLMKFKVKVWILGLVAVASIGAYVVYEEQILIAMERNREESSDDLGEHVRSISNISSDASNLERLNRWNSAIAMWKERPFFGWGPGTYMFQYAPFQASRDRTIISTNFGLGGNAHSEYLGPLSEGGILGMLSILAIVIATLYTAIRRYQKLPPGRDRRLLLAALMGMVTYYLHGILNNYLDTDKASVPFWCFTAVIVLIDLKYKYPSREAGHQDGDIVEIG